VGDVRRAGHFRRSAVLLFAVIPFGPNMVFANISVSLVYFLAISSLPVLANFMAGWSANNKYSLFGAIRIVAMTISYETPLVMSLLGAVVITSTLSLQGMVFWADEYKIWLAFVQPLHLSSTSSVSAPNSTARPRTSPRLNPKSWRATSPSTPA